MIAKNPLRPGPDGIFGRHNSRLVAFSVGTDEKRAHRGSHHDLMNDRNLCVFISDGVFGNHSSLNTLAHSKPIVLLGSKLA
jgi:hypothetical protein